MPFTQTQQPSDDSGSRYSKAFRYAFAMLNENESPPDVDGSVDDYNPTSVVNGGRFVTLLLPQQLSWREPYATVVTVMQDGGKVVESKGGVLRIGTISGTTGFLPPHSPIAALKPSSASGLVPNVADIDAALGLYSGYLAFQKLRYLFRMYADQRRLGNINVRLHFFDYKNDDFWRVEPESFDWQRSSRRPMSYDYNVQFKALEYSDVYVKKVGLVGSAGSLLSGATRAAAFNNVATNDGIVSKIAGGGSLTSKTGLLAAVARLSSLASSGLAFLDNCDAVVQRAFQFALNNVNAVVGIFQAANDAFFAQLNLASSLIADTSAEIDFLTNTAEEFAPSNINAEINEWALETRRLIDNMGVQVGALAASQPQQDVKNTDVAFSQGRMKQGATTDLMQEPAGGSGSPDQNPFIGASGLSLVTDVDALANNSQYTTVYVNSGDDIFALARRTLGDVNRFIDLVLLNQLEAPYIVSSLTQKPPNTLAWGESIRVPATSQNTTGTTIADGVDTSVVPTTGGTVTTSSLPSQLIDTTASWMPDQWVGYSVAATTGSTSQTLICQGNTATQLTFGSNWTITITPGTTTYTITYNLFSPRRPVTPDARAYGQDLLVVYGSDGRCDIQLGATSDLAAASGLDNLFQAISLRARCPAGMHPFHPDYGMPAPVGRPFTDSVSLLAVFFMRRSLLSDPRVGAVTNVQLDDSGDTLMLNMTVQPVDSRTARPISTQVGQ